MSHGLGIHPVLKGFRPHLAAEGPVLGILLCVFGR